MHVDSLTLHTCSLSCTLLSLTHTCHSTHPCLTPHTAQTSDIYKLPEGMALKVQEQYERDVARLHGGPVVSMDAEYKSFLAELGGAPPPELMGLDTGGAARGAD